MDWTFVLLTIFLIVLLIALFWRPPRGRRRNVEEAIAEEALRREQDKNVTDATYYADRYNLPGRGGRRS